MQMATKTPSRAEIKESLEMQLQRQGANVSHFMDLICDYMAFYDIKKKLEKDIKVRGVSYETTSATGFMIIKQNQSVKDLVAVNKQMLMVLEKLKLTTENSLGNGEDDEKL